MDATGPQELVEWVSLGHGFVGLHCASDTLHNFLPYIEMIASIVLQIILKICIVTYFTLGR